MKKVKIITISDNNNYGNRLQSYALQIFLININNSLKVRTFWKRKYKFFRNTKINIKLFIKKIIRKKDGIRYFEFLKFNKNIKLSKKISNYDYYIVGSDQVWNPNFACKDYQLLTFTTNDKKISYAASIGLDRVDKEISNKFKENITNFKAISVREDAGKKILERVTSRKDIEVLIDPTLLLTDKQWDKVSKKPKMLDCDKYILLYFLGSISDERMKIIKDFADENNCKIINLLDRNSKYYTCGPSEFLYLEKHAFLICTDSFHSSVFGLIYNRPFIIFDREQKGMNNMGSRIDTLISKFKLKNRRFNGKNITEDNINHDYKEAYKILEIERKKSENFLKRALDIKD